MQFARFLGLLEQNLGLHAESVSWNLHEASVGGVASAQHSRQSHKTVSPGNAHFYSVAGFDQWWSEALHGRHRSWRNRVP